MKKAIKEKSSLLVLFTLTAIGVLFFIDFNNGNKKSNSNKILASSLLVEKTYYSTNFKKNKKSPNFKGLFPLMDGLDSNLYDTLYESLAKEKLDSCWSHVKKVRLNVARFFIPEKMELVEEFLKNIIPLKQVNDGSCDIEILALFWEDIDEKRKTKVLTLQLDLIRNRDGELLQEIAFDYILK